MIDFYIFFKRKKNFFIFNYIYNYIYFFSFFKINIYFFKKILKFRIKIFYLYLTFKNKRIFLNLKNKKKKNIFFLSQGMFIKFFEKKKSLKKNKNIKLLMAKFLRKIIFITKIKNLIIYIRNNPLHLVDFLFFLNSPIIHKYINPENQKFIEENDSGKSLFKIMNLIFFKNIDFSKNKTKKKGRIKRKITRKLIINNNLTD